jgi:type II secretory pathway predicted ATPase ExeA
VEHLQHFGLSEDPFQNEPRLRGFFETRPSHDALTRLERGLRQSKGLLVLTGDVGSGKTMVLRRLLENLEEELFEASMLVVLNGAADAHWMLTRFARQLGVGEPAAEREPLLAQVYEQLAVVREDGRQAVLIIDDAHALATHETLSEVCGLLKLEYEERRLFSLVLSGGPELEAAIAADPTLSRRVEVRVPMAPLDARGSAAYVEHKVRQAGGTPAIIDAAALAALHQLGGGRPGLLNTLADNALFEAFLCGRQHVTRTDVERAHGDLGWASGAAGAAAARPAQAAPTGTAAPARSRSAPPDAGLGDLESDLEAAFESATAGSREPRRILGAPPKDDDLGEDLVVELLED